ncbi:MAG: cytochrome c [Candidatus Rokubacteria bacterium]|nr:cytochrome c [Candidatus Rokubacteria bacterium]
MKIAVITALIVLVACTQGQAQSAAERGKYLVEVLAACGNCHTPKGPQGDLPDKILAGGFVIEEEFGKAITPNITPDKETGIGNWTDEQLIRAINGVSVSGRPLLPPMPWPYYAGKIADADMKAIVAYLRSLKPIKNKVPAPRPPKK